jgi:diguanylate cyclase (GGDEF)-like protein
MIDPTPAPPPAERRQLRVLLVEDSLAEAGLMIEALYAADLSRAVTHTETLHAASAMLAVHPFDVILLDLTLPDSTGLDTVVDLRRLAPETPIVVLTGLDDEALAVRVGQAGAQDYLLKDDASPRMLRRIVRYAIERERLLRRAATDPLTGIANRRTFYERLAGEVERAHRYGRPLSVAVFDLDKFKELNDSYGHAAGDEVLDAFARRLAGHHRQGELVARLGGDEFAALLPETDADGGFAFAERNEPLSPHAVVGLSAGIADVEDGRDAHELLRLADEALYWAKGHGRDGSFRWSRDLIERFTQGERAERMDRLQVLAGLRALARVLDARDRGTAGHSERVADLVAALARRRGWGADRTARLREAALIHDVGKVGVPADVLASPGPLVPPRLEQIRRHAALGAQIAREALDDEQAAWIRAQHEQMDGHGYPDGLQAEAIPEGARLLAAADAFDVMTRTTVYAPARDVADALEECRRVAGTQLDRTIVDLLEAALDDRVDADVDVAAGREADAADLVP